MWFPTGITVEGLLDIVFPNMRRSLDVPARDCGSEIIPMHIYVNTCHSTPRSQLCLKLLTHSPSTYTNPLIQLSSAIPVAAMNPFSFNRLLNTLFPVDGPYEIVPQFKSPGTQESIDFVAIFLVEVNRHPVFFIEVKPTASFPYDSKRKEADEQMRNRFMELRQNLNITRLSFYKYDSATQAVQSKRIICSNPDILTDVAPVTCLSIR